MKIPKVKFICILLVMNTCFCVIYGKEVPVSPAWQQEIAAVFFSRQQPDPQKIAAFERNIKQRMIQVCGFVAKKKHYPASEQKLIEINRHKKAVKRYLILLREIEKLKQCTLRKAFMVQASRVLELDYALKSFGTPLLSTRVLKQVPNLFKIWKIPIKKNRAGEAFNLYNPATGNFYSQAELNRLRLAGTDISALDPGPDSPYWSPISIEDVDIRDFYLNGRDKLHRESNICFPHKKAYLKEIRKTQTKPKLDIYAMVNGKKREFKLKAGNELHSEVTASALYTALGFYTDVNRHLRNFRVILGKTSPEAFRMDWNSYYSDYNLDELINASGHDAEGYYIVFKEVTLEAKPDNIMRMGPWSYKTQGHADLREVRASLLFNMWVNNIDMKEADNNKIMAIHHESEPQYFFAQHDLGYGFGNYLHETPASFPWELVTRKTGKSIFLRFNTYWETSWFNRAGYNDLKWMARLISRLSRRQIKTAVEIGGWPEPVSRLLTEKLIARRNQLVRAFGLSEKKLRSQKKITMLQCRRKLTTPDRHVVNGKLKKFSFPGFSYSFKPELYGIVSRALQGLQTSLVKALVAGTGNIQYIKINPRWVGMDRSIVSWIILRMNRQIQENPFPTCKDDIYLVKDTLTFGIRLGYGWVVSGSAALIKTISITYPVSSEKEGRYHRGFIYNLLLPAQAKGKNLPERFAILKESYLDGQGRLRIEGDDFGLKIGAETTAGRIMLDRQILLRRSPEKIFFLNDSGKYSELALRLYAELFSVIRIPLFHYENSRGKLRRLVTKIKCKTEADKQKAAQSMLDFLKRNDPSALISMGKKIDLNDIFMHRNGRLSLFGFISTEGSWRTDDLEILNSFPKQKYFQAEKTKIFAWNFLDNGESHEVSGRLSAAMDQKGLIHSPVLWMNILTNDKSTGSGEIKNNYLSFINPLSGKNNFINFTPDIHSGNRIWGPVRISIRIGFNARALRKLADTPGKVLIKKMKSRLARSSGPGFFNARENQVSGFARRRLRFKTRRISAMLEKNLGRDREKEKLLNILKILIGSVYRSAHWHEVRILTQLIEICGRENVFIHASMAPPANRENRFPGNRILQNRTGPRIREPELIFQHEFVSPADVFHFFRSLKFR